MTMTHDPLIGRQLGDYRIIDILGRGGMAHVYRGFDKKLQRYAAVKVIDAGLLASNEGEDEYRARFQREARAIAHLSHPNIVGVYQFGEVGPLYYMAMVFIEGRDLGHILKEHAANGTPMPQDQIIQIIRDISSALDHAHNQGVIHRDIKPSNIMVTSEGRAVLTDFGLALSVPEGSVGNTFGSAHYIAPEQAISSAKAIPQSDLYSLGIVLYQMLTGKVPFDDPSAMSVALKHLSETPPPVRHYNPKVPIAAEKVVMKALEKEPSKRYRSGESLADALEDALLGNTGTEPRASSKPSRPSKAKLTTGEYRRLPTTSPSPTLPEALLMLESRPKRRRVPVLAMGAITVIAVALLAVAFSLGRGNASPEPTLSPTLTEASIVLVSTTDPTVTTTPEQPEALITEDASASPTDTEEIATTPAPTVTPTPIPTVTPPPIPTDVPTALPTDVSAIPETATVEAGVEAAFDPNAPHFTLSYDQNILTLLNTSPVTINLFGLSFVQRVGESEITFLAQSWTNAEWTNPRLLSSDCLQLWTSNVNGVQSPRECVSRQGWRQPSITRWFWVSGVSDAVFEVRRNNQVLQVCQISAGQCRVNLSS